MKAVIILSCEGRQDKGFNFCSGVENIVLDLDGLEVTDSYLDLIDYLDKVPGVFDNPCCKSNIITNSLYKLYELNYLSEEIYNRIADFYRFHNRCGLILSARIKEDNEELD